MTRRGFLCGDRVALARDTLIRMGDGWIEGRAGDKFVYLRRTGWHAIVSDGVFEFAVTPDFLLHDNDAT